VLGIAIGALIGIYQWLSLSNSEVSGTKSNQPKILNSKKTTPFTEKEHQIEKPASDPEEVVKTPQAMDNPIFSASLKDTDIDGALRADANNQLIVDRSTRDFFDYFISASSEVGLAASVDEILRYAKEYLPAEAAAQVAQLLNNYLQYLSFDYELKRTPLNKDKTLSGDDYLQILKDGFSALRTKRQQLFSPTTDRMFFGEDDDYANYTLEMMEIQTNKDMDIETKTKMIAQARSKLPAAIAESDLAQAEIQKKADKVANLTASNMDESQLYDALLETGLTQENANAIIAQRKESAIFENTISQYLPKRDQILNSQKSSSERQKLIKELKSSMFTTSEQRTQASLRENTYDYKNKKK